MMNEKAAIFDLDGIVVDTARFHYQAWRELAQRLGFDFTPADNERLKGVSRMESLDILLSIGHIRADEAQREVWAAQKNARYGEMLRTLGEKDVLPGVRDFLAALQRADVRTALGSASKNAPFILRQIGLADAFDAVVDGNTVSRAKPDPEVFLQAAEKLGTSPTGCVVFEDAAAGVAAAHAGCMTAVGIGAPEVLHGADLCVPDLRDWLELMPLFGRGVDLCGSPFSLTREEVRRVEQVFSSLTDRQKAGQLFCVLGNLYGDDELDRLVQDYAVGGVLFRPYPKAELKAKFARLDALAPVPLLKAANLEEGGSGAAACVKHFPGDGVDYRDQHLHPSWNTLSAREWDDTYGKNYRRCVEAGVLSFMVGHIVQPNVIAAVDAGAPRVPATSSRVMLREVLRRRLGFNGLIVSDATIMGGYCMGLPRKKAIPASIMAGCDMLVFNTDFYEDYEAILTALADGSLTKARLDEAVLRILALKTVVNRPVQALPAVDAAGWKIECAEQSVTLVKNNGGILPVTPQRWQRICLVPLGSDETGEGSLTGIVRRELEKRGFSVEQFDAETETLASSRKIPEGRLMLYLANLEPRSDQTALRIYWSLHFALDLPRYPAEQPQVFVSFSNPYHLQDVPCIQTYINAYTATEATACAVVEKLCGESQFQGRSPTDAFCGLPDTRL